jgi:hypothetical protein
MKRFLTCLILLLVAGPLLAQSKPTPLLMVDTGTLPASDSVNGANVSDPILAALALPPTPFVIELRLEAARNVAGSAFASFYPNLGRLAYTDTAWRSVSGAPTAIITYFGVPFVIDKAAGKVSIEFSTKYSSTIDLAKVLLSRRADGDYDLTFSVTSYYGAAPTFTVTARVPKTAVTFY